MGWGFLDSLVHGAETIINNAGAIGGAIKAVSDVAKQLKTPDADLLDISVDLGDAFNAATRVISIASQILPAATKPSIVDVTTQTRTETRAGLFLAPTILMSNGHLGRPMYEALSKNLANMGVPTSYVGTDGATHDLADDIGQAAFANAPLPSALSSNDLPYQTVGFQVNNIDNTLNVKGNHAYYAVPLGQDGSSSMWHSATTIATTTTQKFRDNYKKQPGTQTVYNKTLEVFKQEGSSTWIVSLNVTWSSQTYAQQIYPTFSSLWQTTNGDTIIYKNPIGTTWQLKIQAAAGASPAQVRAAVEDIAQQCIKQGPPGAKITLQQDVETLPPPAVEVTNSALTFV
ncbi:hypothetical protein BU23DRAFT_653658 [Bimuria novae-zelandiae CBS 107.79]|uniref:Uncharacterized protein n=1 Tax=Bimuria novae-zelandiae CBS 107.79 TaxID=1447943 RepID=A0A6A5UWQ7_9PLEO|nr:hypothetical protein BU23DRAFT_653658 [Bimuria novae-zelandiae CBS 107.79]